MTIKEIVKYAAVCAVCGDMGPEAFTEEGAARQARDKGWADVGDRTMCPPCRAVRPVVEKLAKAGMI